jgi:hypothetical protein
MRTAYALRMTIDHQDRVPDALMEDELIIGWANAQELLSPHLSRQDFNDQLHEAHYSDQPTRRKAAGAGRNMWRFLRELRIGDWVVVPQGPKRFYLAQVIGYPTYDVSQNRDCYRRRVRWLQKDPLSRASHPQVHQALRGNITTCFPLPNVTEYIEALVRNLGGTIEDGPSLELQDDLNQINCSAVGPTSRASLIQARLGQGVFRAEVLARWDTRCAVTGTSVYEVIRASHLKPWRLSSNEERLDPDNGLPLIATLDALFDRGLISFEDDGSMLVSGRLPRTEHRSMGVPAPLRSELNAAQRTYLDFHRKNLFLSDDLVEQEELEGA